MNNQPTNQPTNQLALDTIYNMDCLDGMRQIPSGSIDCIICDLPYGTMKGIGDEWGRIKSGQHEWDEIIPSDQLFEQYERVLRKDGASILFSQEPYTSHLRTFNPKNIDFCYPLIWIKDHPGNHLMAKKAPVSYFEDINVFRKANPLHDFDCAHPLRPYFAKVLEFIGMGLKKINDALGHRHAEHTFYINSSQFALCTEETYKELIARFGIDKMDGFRSYEDLKAEDSTFIIKKEFEPTFNLPEGAKSLSNVLEFSKDTDGFHPTQKPVALIRRLIQTYSNEGDTILDNCMGSGTTAIAAIREKRHFIGFELNAEYYEKAVQRIKNEKSQLTLF